MTSNIKRLLYFEKWVDPIAETILAERSDIDLVRLEYGGDLEENWQQMGSAHGYQIAPRTELKPPWFGDADLLARAPNLLAISSTGAGFDMIDVDACTEAGVLVVNQSGSNKEPVAEHALAFMIALSKKISLAGTAMRRKPGVDRFRFPGNDIMGKTVGIVGIGNIGTRTAELCRTLFAMPVLAYDPYLSEAQVAARGARKVGLDELLRLSDFVTLHCPRNDETFRMFALAQFALMKPTAYFINTARGGIHDEGDLVDALERSVIAGAGVDVFLDEPPAPEHPLLGFDNVIATPHIAGITIEALGAMAAGSARQWMMIFDGTVPPRVVNPEVWSCYSARFKDLLGFRPSSRA